MVTSPHNADLTEATPSPRVRRTGIAQLSALLSPLRRFLERIKNFPWFSVLSLIMLTWVGYQMMTHPHSPSYNRFKQAIQRIEGATRKAVEINFNKHAKRANAPPPSTIASDVHSPQEASAAVNFSAYDKKLVALEHQLETMKITLNTLQQNNDTLTKALEDITCRFETISQAPETKTPPLIQTPEEVEAEPLPEPTEALPDTEEEHYSVHAVIQGRAWLRNNAGKMLTVNVGSQLTPLGIVQAIDAENRLVYFENGHCVGPSPNDS